MRVLIADNTAGVTAADRVCIEPLERIVSDFADVEVIQRSEISNLAHIIQKTGSVAVIGSGVPKNEDYGVQSLVEGLERWRPVLRDIDISLFGICFMHQVLGMERGAKLMTDEGTQVGIYRINIVEPDDPAVIGLSDGFDAEMEHYCSITSPLGYILLGSSDGCVNSMMKDGKPGTNTVSTQFHPERPVEEEHSIYVPEMSSGKIIFANFIASAEQYDFARAT